MEQEIQKINDKMKELRNEKERMKTEIANKKVEERKEKKNNKICPNDIIRVSKVFTKELIDIDKKREGLGLEPLSNPKKTELFIKWRDYQLKQKPDIINYDLKKEKKNAH